MCSILSFWTGRDDELIDSIFRQSLLYRPKWNEKHFSNGKTYGQETILKAIELCRKVYTPFVHPSIKEIEGYLHNQERGDAELLSSLFKQEFLYDHIAQSWLRYENGVWNQDQKKQTMRISVEELTKVYLAASSEIDQQITELIAEKNTAYQ